MFAKINTKSLLFYFSGKSNLDFRMFQPSKELSSDKNRSLIDAIRQNNLTNVLHLIENGAEVKPQSRRRLEQPLHYAIYHGHEQIVEALILIGANINIKHSDVYFPIHKAVIKNQIAIVEILLRNGANIEAKCKNFSETPICYAIQYGFTEMVKVLLRYGARIDQPNRRTSIYPIENAIFCNNKEILEILLKTKPNLNQQLFKILLHDTVLGGNVEFVEMLIEYRLEVNSYVSAIHLAITHNRDIPIKITEMLFRKGASAKIRNQEGNSLLECALKKESAKKLAVLKVIFHNQHNLNV